MSASSGGCGILSPSKTAKERTHGEGKDDEGGCADGHTDGRGAGGMTDLRRRIVGGALVAVSVATFAATFVVGAALTRVDGVSPEVLSFLRFAIAGGVMFAWEARSAAGRRRLFVEPTRRDWLLFAALGPVGTSVMAWCVFMGCARVSTANASMADALAPLLIFALAAFHARRVTGIYGV